MLGVLHESDSALVGASVSASSSDSSYPVANIQGTPVSQPWRSTGKSSEWVLVDCGSARSVSVIALVGHNLTSNATVTYSAGATSGCGDYSTPLSWRARTMAKIIGTISYRYHKFAFSDSGNPNGFIQVGLAMIGTLNQSLPSPRLGAEEQIEYANLEHITEAGVALISAGYYRTRWTMRLDGMTSAQAAALRTLVNYLGHNKYGALWIPATITTDHVLFGRLAAPVGISHERLTYGANLEIIEDSPGYILL